MRLKALFRVRLLSLKSSLTGANRSNRKRSKAQLLGFGVLMLYTFGYFAFMLFTTFDTLAEPFSAMGLGVIYFALAALMAFALMFVGSVFSAKAQLYEATDNDLLLSMPIKPGEVLLSRMLLLLVMNLLFGTVVSAPAMAAWGQAAGFSVGSFICCFFVLFVLLPLIALRLPAASDLRPRAQPVHADGRAVAGLPGGLFRRHLAHEHLDHQPRARSRAAGRRGRRRRAAGLARPRLRRRRPDRARRAGFAAARDLGPAAQRLHAAAEHGLPD